MNDESTQDPLKLLETATSTPEPEELKQVKSKIKSKYNPVMVYFAKNEPLYNLFLDYCKKNKLKRSKVLKLAVENFLGF